MSARLLHDRYELGEILGGGSSSRTYLATDRETGGPCVVKALSVGETVRSASREGQTHSYDSDDFTKLIELFEREARVLANVQHAGIPRLVDHFREEEAGDTWLYTVQEHVPGRTLQALVEGGRHFTEEEAKDVCRQVAEILAYLHGRSPPLIHRDIKPANVILDDDGVVHLVDFGSVRNVLAGDDLDGRTIVGTYGYMPVEQYEARAVPQSDFYALGMTLVFLLSHREPTKIPRRGMKLEFRSMVNVSDGFARTIDKMIEAAPEDRHASAAELIRDLEGKSRAVPPVRRPRHTQAPQAWAVVASVVMLAVVGAILVPVFFGYREASVRGGGAPGTSGSAGARGSGGPLRPVDGVLTVDLDRDFRYVDEGFAMRRAAGQTNLPTITRRPAEPLTVPREWTEGDADVWYGYFPLGNGPDPRISFALGRIAGAWVLLVDRDNDGDATDDGPPIGNQGTGPLLAAEVAVEATVVGDDGRARVRPYHLWTWFNRQTDGGISGRFYARNHYAGEIRVGDRAYAATAFEQRGHDALYRDAGLCIDLDPDGVCVEEEELFHDGDLVPFPDGPARLQLAYP